MTVLEKVTNFVFKPFDRLVGEEKIVSEVKELNSQNIKLYEDIKKEITYADYANVESKLTTGAYSYDKSFFAKDDSFVVMLNNLYASAERLKHEITDKDKYINYTTEILVDTYPDIEEAHFNAKRLMDNKSNILGISDTFTYNIQQVSTDLNFLISSIDNINNNLDKLPVTVNTSIKEKSHSELKSKIDVIKNTNYNLLNSYDLAKEIQKKLKLLNKEFDNNLKAIYALINEIEFQLRPLCLRSLCVNNLKYDKFRENIMFCYVNIDSIKKRYDKIKPLSEKMKYDIIQIMALLKQIEVDDKQLKSVVNSMLNVLRKGYTS